MTTDQIKQLRDDFAAWTGGFGPESGNQIRIYIESRLGVEVDADAAIDELLRWMHEDEDAADPHCDIIERAKARGHIS
jgi:hypothetical protein